MRQDGFNLMGLAHLSSGMGEDLRMMAAMLDVLGIPYSVQALRDDGRSMHQMYPPFLFKCEDHFEVTLVFLDVFNLQTVRDQAPQLFDQQRMVIGYSPWELPDFPADQLPALECTHMTWCPSQFARDSYLKSTDKPVFALPFPSRLPVPSQRDFRPGLGIPVDDFVVLYMYDNASGAARKNPAGTVEAFRRFAADHNDAWLLLKCHRLNHAEAQAWEEELNHPRIRILADSLDGPDLAALYASADCYLSLHRSEGYGRTVAEALQSGLPIVTTNFSAPGEYLSADTAWLVRWTPKEVKPGDYPFACHSWWAEPDLDDAARQLERVYRHRQGIDRERLRQAGQAFKVETLASRYESVFDACLRPQSLQATARDIAAILGQPASLARPLAA